MFEALDGGEKFEDHKEDQNEARQNNSVHIALYTDDAGESVAEIREEYDGGHATPDDDASNEFEESLVIFAFEEVARSLIEHEPSED